MATKRLTDTVISNAKAPKSGRLELWDSLLPGFGLRVTDKGTRTWFVMYRADTAEGRKQRRMKIGEAGEGLMSLADARDKARDALRTAARGADPAEKPAQAIGPADSFKAVADDYLRRYVAKNTRPSTYKETKRILDVDVIPAWGARPVGSITRLDVNALLGKIADRGAEVQANRTLARLRTLFNWAADEEYIALSPVLRMKPRTRERSRDRALSHDEIKWFWASCGTLGWPFGPLFKLLLVTAQRRDEVSTIELPEIDEAKALWTIPRQKAKNDRAHEVTLSGLALKIIGEINATRRMLDELKGSTLMFTTNGKTPVSGFSRAKERLDEAMEKLAREARGLPKDDDDLRKALKLKAGDELPRYVPQFILHDLRRTAATGMADLKIAPHVVDRILNHVSGTIRGVARIYNRSQYGDERKEALEAWGQHVEALVRPAGGNVVQLAARG